MRNIGVGAKMNKENKEPLGRISITLAILSLLFFPPILGLAGLITSIIGLSNQEGQKALIGLILSLTLPWIGMLLSIIVFL